MAVDEDLAERVRAVLAGSGELWEVKMFGGLCFMLNGNMVAGTSRRGLLVRVGKEQHAPSLARPDARPMEMSGRLWLRHRRPAAEGCPIIARMARARRRFRPDPAGKAAEIEGAEGPLDVASGAERNDHIEQNARATQPP